jgi:hypothetical protein
VIARIRRKAWEVQMNAAGSPIALRASGNVDFPQPHLIITHRGPAEVRRRVVFGQYVDPLAVAERSFGPMSSERPRSLASGL